MEGWRDEIRYSSLQLQRTRVKKDGRRRRGRRDGKRDEWEGENGICKRIFDPSLLREIRPTSRADAFYKRTKERIMKNRTSERGRVTKRILQYST